ncbi:MAG: diaminobutyrate acetyltransferase [Planctomycetota bacterium JB042]
MSRETTETPRATAERTRTRGPTPDVRFRKPSLRDGAAVWELALASRVLDPNSPYAYLMWCDHFSDASVVAEVDGAPAGFVCGLRPPRAPDVLFVWQVAVSDEHRGAGIAGRMLDELIEREGDVRYVEATVTPSNEPSSRLFRALARRRGVACEESPYLTADDFPAGATHEPEHRFRIGPLPADRTRSPEDDR